MSTNRIFLRVESGETSSRGRNEGALPDMNNTSNANKKSPAANIMIILA